MVYRGKPSKACLPCRKRKLLCDQNPNGCSSCKRALLVCCGYRDTQALRITDETSAIQARFGAKKLDTIPKTVTVPARRQAKDLFYYNYVVGTAQPLDFLNPYYDPSSTDGEHIFQSIDAVALAYLNFQRRSAGVEKAARQHYVAALKLTRLALQDPRAAKKDSTILSVLLLDMFEKIAHADVSHDEAWATHIEGALALVKLRGDEQYADPNGVRIIKRLTTNMIINCIATNRPVPPELIRLRRQVASSFSEKEDPKWRETDLMLDWIEFRHRYTQGTLSDDDIVRATTELDSNFLGLSKNIELHWQYEVVHVSEKSRHHYESYHHVYQDEESARMWNVLRLTRILINEHICYHYPIECPETLASAKRNIEEMIRQICATVPQFIHGVRNADGPLGGQASSQTELRYCGRKLSRDEAQLAHHLPCYRLLYPLYIAAQSPWTPPGAKDWIVRQLRFMADFHAIENAAKIANILEQEVPMDPWNVYKVLGSYAFVC